MSAAPPDGTRAAAPGEAVTAPSNGAPPSRWRRALPFVLMLALIAFVLGRIDRHALVRDLAAVNLPLYAGFVVAFVFALLTADTFATVFVYRRTIAKVGYRDFWLLRGASYLPSILNHHLGQAYITYFLSRRHGVPLFRVAGATLLVYASWSGLLLALGGLALWMNGMPVAWVVGALGVGVLYLVVLALRPARLAHVQLLAPLFAAGVTGHLLAVAVRLPHFLVMFFGTWLSFSFFGVRIDATAAVTYIPILLVVGSLPITPQGFGTRDLLSAMFFERFAPGAAHADRLAALAAATTSWGVMLTIVDAAVGFALMKWGLPEGAMTPPSETAVEAPNG